MRRTIIGIILLAVIASLAFWFFYWKLERPKDYIVLYGNVDVRQVDIGFRVSGLVKAMPFQEGDLVESGALMAELDTQPYADQVNQAQATRESVQLNYANTQRLLKRRQELIAEGGVSQEDLENTQASYDILAANLREAEAALAVAKTNLSFTQAYAPTRGTILTRIREPGTVVNPGDPVYTLSIISPVWIRAYVSEQDLGVVYPGMPAEVYTDTPGGKIYKGHVGFISPVAEFTPKTVETTNLRTDLVYRLRIIVDNPDWGLRQGMPVTVRLFKKQNDQQEQK